MYCKYGMTENKRGLYLERLKGIIISLLNYKYKKARGAIGSRLWSYTSTVYLGGTLQLCLSLQHL